MLLYVSARLIWYVYTLNRKMRNAKLDSVYVPSNSSHPPRVGPSLLMMGRSSHTARRSRSRLYNFIISHPQILNIRPQSCFPSHDGYRLEIPWIRTLWRFLDHHRTHIFEDHNLDREGFRLRQD
jgi:hypothetical protein